MPESTDPNVVVRLPIVKDASNPTAERVLIALTATRTQKWLHIVSFVVKYSNKSRMIADWDGSNKFLIEVTKIVPNDSPRRCLVIYGVHNKQKVRIHYRPWQRTGYIEFLKD